MGDVFAHSAKDDRSWETLTEHLTEVAELAASFANAFDGSDWARLAGLWHDVGKAAEEFQAYLRATSDGDFHSAELRGKIDHTSAGAQHAVASYAKLGLPLAYIIAGHHAGLLDYVADGTGACLKNRLEKDLPSWSERIATALLDQALPPLPQFPKSDCHTHGSFRVAFWIRMLFSTLVDADFLATEKFMSPERAGDRPVAAPTVAALGRTLVSHMDRLMAGASPTSVNRHRAKVFTFCREQAEMVPGFFDLCVPTGGGKTLSSLAFALDHAAEHNLRRVVVAIPFTSIIEQNAQVFHDVFAELGEDVVLEHHSNLDPDNETITNRLQSENWDAPLVVTTNVQFFESLFANRTSRCRKLHNLAKSVIILDEVQTLPVELLKPTLWALRELVDVYGCTVVLCSATQPALALRDDFSIGLKDVRPIIHDSSTLHEALRRTKVTIEGVIEDEELAQRLAGLSQVLCIVNTRRHAASLFETLGTVSGHFHLSTRMCASHRFDVLENIRCTLDSGRVCRVVSTQLVEAGVDLDFPVVYRARCGLDSLAQAAGRCNREGRLESGDVISFATELPPPKGILRQTAAIAEEVLKRHDDPISQAAIEAYFRLRYWLQQDQWDARNVLTSVGDQPNNMRFQFREIADRYRFIRDEGHNVIVPWQDKGRELVEQLRGHFPPDRVLRRRLQRLVVQVHDHELRELQDAGSLELLQERWVLINSNNYDDRLGLVLDRSWEVEDLIV